MKHDLDRVRRHGAASLVDTATGYRSESAALRDVLLCPPTYLAPVPCCSVTRESLRAGFTASTARALDQHRALRTALEEYGVACHILPAAADLPDLCFTRDIAAATPFGIVALNPAMPHRRREVDQLVSTLAAWGSPVAGRIAAGTIEGGDICVARDGLLIVGVSGERTTDAGADAFAHRFRAAGWDVLVCRFDPHFLHLDTIFCMLDERTALACTDVLDDAFIADVEARGLRLLPVSYKESRRLGCNVVSLDGRTILVAAGQDRIATMLREAGFAPVPVDISEFAACGGGLHCLTMPLARG